MIKILKTKTYNGLLTRIKELESNKPTIDNLLEIEANKIYDELMEYILLNYINIDAYKTAFNSHAPKACSIQSLISAFSGFSLFASLYQIPQRPSVV